MPGCTFLAGSLNNISFRSSEYKLVVVWHMIWIHILVTSYVLYSLRELAR